MPNCQEHQRQEVRQILVPEETKSFEDVSAIESKQFYQNENLPKKVLFLKLKRNAKEKIHFAKTVFNTEVAEWNIGITKLSTDLGRDSIWLPLSRQCQKTTLQRQNEAVVPTNSRKRRNLARQGLLVGRRVFFHCFCDKDVDATDKPTKHI